jgi:transcriptional regulator with XRE-family HTH domain
MHHKDLRAAETQSVVDHGMPSVVLEKAVRLSGRTRREIAARTGIHKDALRRILTGQRSPTLSEALRILEASNASTISTLVLTLSGDRVRADEWIDQPVAHFLDGFLSELPAALERALGNQLAVVRPRWAKGTAHRVARLLSDHIDEIERKDRLLDGEGGIGHG